MIIAVKLVDGKYKNYKKLKKVIAPNNTKKSELFVCKK